jgi:3-isopropylmalate/(R)-2-methylmalate dehydratase small subunit
MEKFTVLNGLVAPLDRANVDTDQIIPKEHLKSIKRTGFSAALFGAWRKNPEFLINQPRYKAATILLARKNFGCGSSREHAPWALMDYGFRCVIAPSFGDIFYGNCFQNGMLPVRLPLAEVEAIAAELEHRGGELTVDLVGQQVATASGRVIAFEIEPGRRKALLEGLDAIGATLTYAADIDRFQARDRVQRPWLYRTVP